MSEEKNEFSERDRKIMKAMTQKDLCKHDFNIKGDFIICSKCGFISHERPKKE